MRRLERLARERARLLEAQDRLIHRVKDGPWDVVVGTGFHRGYVRPGDWSQYRVLTEELTRVGQSHA